MAEVVVLGHITGKTAFPRGLSQMTQIFFFAASLSQIPLERLFSG